MRRFVYILTVAAGLAAAAAGIWTEGGSASAAVPGPPVIRFHVIANSDSPSDQALKLKVRDAVVREMGPALSGAGEIGEARARVDASLDLIKATAERVLEENGRPLPVRVIRGSYEFPDKTYRVAGESGQAVDLTFPAGSYEAVRVVIGSGRGANWWCVLFPPLCFVNPLEKGDPARQTPAGEKSPGRMPAFKYDRIRPEETGAAPAVEYRLKVVDWYRQFFDKN